MIGLVKNNRITVRDTKSEGMMSKVDLIIMSLISLVFGLAVVVRGLTQGG